MRIAFMADLHANREAFEACLAHAGARGVERFVFLGDYVGYGADPEWVVNKLIDLSSSGAIAVLGNHDAAMGDAPSAFDTPARRVAEWTRSRLGAAEKAFLAGLPEAATEEDRLYVHAEAASPRRWTYVRDAETADRSLGATGARLTFCGHVHEQALYTAPRAPLGGGRASRFRPRAETEIPAPPPRRWLAVVGSVGQPRDGDPAAAYAILDAAVSTLTFHRVPYDVEAAAAKILAAGLPAVFAERLRDGS